MKNKNYLVNELENKRNLNIYLISHNAYWSDLTRLEKFENCKVDISGECGFAWGKGKDKGEYSDIILYYSSGFFNKEDLEILEQKISRISERDNKRVSLGYSYIIPMEKRIDKEKSEEMIMISYNKGVRDELRIDIDNSNSPLMLAGILLQTNDEFENQKVKKYK